MIPKDYITAWRAQAPWRLDAHVEQDLVISRACFDRYMAEDERTVTRAQFEANLAGKRKQPDFRDDMAPILRPGFSWDFDAAMDAILTKLVAHLSGEPWKGHDG